MTSADFIAVSVLGGAALISGRNSRVMECHADAQKHWNTVMSSCLGREGQRLSGVVNEAERDEGGVEGELRGGGGGCTFLGGGGQLPAGFGGGVARCGLEFGSDFDHLC